MKKDLNEASPSSGLLSDRVYREIAHAIKVGEYAGGSKLPAEIDLAAQYQVSRPVLRQALDRLKNEGVISSTRGSGNFVSRGQDTVVSFAPLQTIPDVKRCLEFRLILESAAAATAAEYRSEADLLKIKAAFDHLDTGEFDNEQAVEADYNFHMSIAEASNSQYFVQSLRALRPHILFGINLIRSLGQNDAAARLKRVQAEHQLIFDSIKAADPQAARKAMEEHLQAGINRFFA